MNKKPQNPTSRVYESRFRAWLRTQPNTVAITVAARLALCAVPELLAAFEKPVPYSDGYESFVRVLRALVIVRHTVKNPEAKVDAEILVSAHKYVMAANINASIFTIADAVDHLMLAAVSPTDDVALKHCNASIECAVPALVKLLAYPRSEVTPNEFEDLYRLLVGNLVELGQRPEAVALIDLPLWHGQPPRAVLQRWGQLKSQLQSLDANSISWTRYYDALLIGGIFPGSDQFERFLIQLEDNEWGRGPQAVSGLIAGEKGKIGDRVSDQMPSPPSLMNIRDAQLAISARSVLRTFPILANAGSDNTDKVWYQNFQLVSLAFTHSLAYQFTALVYPDISIGLRGFGRNQGSVFTRANDGALSSAGYAADAVVASLWNSRQAPIWTKEALEQTLEILKFGKVEGIGTLATEAAHQDEIFLAEGNFVPNLMRRALWPHGKPTEIDILWIRLKGILGQLDQDWEVWIRWYESVLDGRPTPGGPELDIYRVTMLESDWKLGPSHVNALIKAKEQEIAARDGETAKSEVPHIPAMRPAAIEPEIVGGRIVLRNDVLVGESGEAVERAAFAGVKVELRGLIQSTEGVSNIDPRFREFAALAVDEIPDGTPSNEQLFRMGHIARTLQGYAGTVTVEWPNLLAAQYHGCVLQFDEALRQFPSWRDFIRNASPLVITEENREKLNQFALDLAEELSSGESPSFLDQAIPRILRLFGQGKSAKIADKIIEEGAKQLAADLLQSVSNVLNPISRIALEYGRNWRDGAMETLLDEARGDGAKIVIWAKRMLVSGAIYGVIHLSGVFPSVLGWIRPVIQSIRSLAP